MPKRLTSREIISVLKDNGFVLLSQKGSHQKWHNAETGAITIVPCHGNDQIPIGTIHAIIRASKLDKQRFGY